MSCWLANLQNCSVEALWCSENKREQEKVKKSWTSQFQIAIDINKLSILNLFNR